MSDSAFVDTNILVYARDLAAGEKQRRAEALMAELWETRRGRISVQVLNEYLVTVTQKLKPGLSRAEAWADLELYGAWSPTPLDWKLLQSARRLAEAHSLSWWDALIVAAAVSSRCAVLYSEDLAHGEIYGGARVVNPFRLSAESEK
jgi:predicted nucleic acid-binding protein